MLEQNEQNAINAGEPQMSFFSDDAPYFAHVYCESMEIELTLEPVGEQFTLYCNSLEIGSFEGIECIDVVEIEKLLKARYSFAITDTECKEAASALMDEILF